MRGNGPRHLINAPAVVCYLRNRFKSTKINWRAARWVAVYPSLGIAYNRIQKNANSSAVVLLNDLEQGYVEHQRIAKKNTRTLFDFGPHASRIPADLTYMVIIRNPYSRVLSAFLNKFKEGSRLRKQHGDFEQTPEGFRAFVHYLRDGGLSGNSHWDLQKKLMVLPLSEYDAVIKFENFREEMIEFLTERGLKPREGSLESFYPGDEGKKTGATEKLERFYSREVCDLVAEIFDEDFSYLGYDKAFPGTLSF